MPEEQRFEMIWDCRYCGNKKMLARTHRHCTTCGAPQDPSWRYFPNESEAVEVKDTTLAVADVICPSCKTPNAKSDQFCCNCGTPLTKAATVRTFGEETRSDGQQFAEVDLKARQEADKAAKYQKTASPPKQSNWSWLIVVVALVIGAIWWFTRTKEATVNVVGHSWQREIKIDKFAAVPTTAWCDSLPVRAYSLRQYRAERSSRKVADGQTCKSVRRDNGDGTYSQRRVCQTNYRSEPVYDDRCDFLINTWVYARSAISNGTNLQNPVTWANPNLRTGSVLGAEREAGRSEKYTLNFAGTNTTAFSCEVAENLWRNSSLGAVFQLKVGKALGNANCDTLTAK